MSLNPKCPHCGGTRAVLTSEHKRHGCLWLILFRIYYVIWTILRWIAGLLVLILFDWWMAILKAIAGKGYVFKSKRFFSPWRRYYYCPDCGTNFRG
jgi:hypothetical protein